MCFQTKEEKSVILVSLGGRECIFSNKRKKKCNISISQKRKMYFTLKKHTE